MSPFRNIARLFAGDFAAKALQFVTFIFLARTLGVESYGILEFALAATSYLILMGDCGVELWATREASRDRNLRLLAGRVFGVRLVLGAIAFTIFLALLPLFPSYPSLLALLLLGGLALAANIANLRWVFLGRERMTIVAKSFVMAQFVATIIALALVRDASDLLWVPIARAAGDFVAVAWFARHFVRDAGGPPNLPSVEGWRAILGPASIMGAIQVLGVLSYNFDSLLLGVIAGPTAVGLYGAAYKVVTIGIAVSSTYYLGLFPALARTWAVGRDAFIPVARRSFGLASLSSLPIGVAGTILAGPAVEFLYGPEYSAATSALRVLCWSAALVSLRGTFRNALTAIGAQNLDLGCAAVSTIANVGLNVALIPRFGMLGAAIATVVADLVWLGLAWYYFDKRCDASRFGLSLVRPAVASALMGGALLACVALPFEALVSGATARAGVLLATSAVLGGVVYAGALLVLGEPEARALVARFRER